MRLIVPYKSQRAVDTYLDAYGGRPTVLLVLVPGIKQLRDYLEPHPDVAAEDIPRILGVPSHIVPVRWDGSSEEINLRLGDHVLLTSETEPFLVWAAARLARDLKAGSTYFFEGKAMTVMAPISPKPVHREAPIEYDYGGD